MLPREPLRAGAGWEEGCELDAPGPGSARVRARRGGAARVHGTGETGAGRAPLHGGPAPPGAHTAQNLGPVAPGRRRGALSGLAGPGPRPGR